MPSEVKPDDEGSNSHQTMIFIHGYGWRRIGEEIRHLNTEDLTTLQNKINEELVKRQGYDPSTFGHRERCAFVKSGRQVCNCGYNEEKKRAENGKFAFPNAVVDWSSAKRLW